MEMSARVTVHSAALKGQAPAIVRQRLKEALHEACAFGTRQIKQRTPQGVYGAQGGLLGSIHFEVRPTSFGAIGVIGTASPYGIVVEKGRRPGEKMPPGSVQHSVIATREVVSEGSLLRWIQVKMGKSVEEALAIEFVVRRSIARKGTKGAEMFAKLLTEDRSTLAAIFDRHGFALATELAAP